VGITVDRNGDIKDFIITRQPIKVTSYISPWLHGKQWSRCDLSQELLQHDCFHGFRPVDQVGRSHSCWAYKAIPVACCLGVSICIIQTIRPLADNISGVAVTLAWYKDDIIFPLSAQEISKHQKKDQELMRKLRDKPGYSDTVLKGTDLITYQDRIYIPHAL
jgi:hypothetical protein